jgi:hypothetical protein
VAKNKIDLVAMKKKYVIVDEVRDASYAAIRPHSHPVLPIVLHSHPVLAPWAVSSTQTTVGGTGRRLGSLHRIALAA